MQPTDLEIIERLMDIRAAFDFERTPTSVKLTVSGYGQEPETVAAAPVLNWSKPTDRTAVPVVDPQAEHYTEEEKERLRAEIIEDKLEQLALEDPSEYERVLSELEDKAGNDVVPR